MKDHHREQLSALLDGETAHIDDLEHTLRQPGACETFGKLCQHRALMHGECCEHLPADFADRISAALADEPVVINPGASRASVSENGPPVAPAPIEEQPAPRRARFLPLAVAASVAAVGFAALVGLSQRGGEQTVPIAQVNSPPAGAPAVSINDAAVRPVTADVRRIDLNRLSPELRHQLLMHLEQQAVEQRPAARAGE